jgi:hypothetical protein
MLLKIFTYLLTPWSRVLEKLRWSRNSPLFWNPKVHYGIHKCPPPFSIIVIKDKEIKFPLCLIKHCTTERHMGKWQYGSLRYEHLKRESNPRPSCLYFRASTNRAIETLLWKPKVSLCSITADSGTIYPVTPSCQLQHFTTDVSGFLDVLKFSPLIFERSR